MNIHEYQAKEILRRFGVPVPEGAVAFTREEAEKIAGSLKADVFAVKSQIHAGGRGKAGGIKIVKTPEEVLKATRELIGKVLVTHQTGPDSRRGARPDDPRPHDRAPFFPRQHGRRHGHRGCRR